MTMRCFTIITLVLSLCLVFANGPLRAAQDNELGFGVYEKPQYPGADESEWVLLPSLKYQTSRLAFALRGERLMLDLVPSPKVNAGFIVRYDEGRKDDMDDAVVQLMATVPDAAELGLYVESGLPVRLLGWDDPALLIGSANLRDAVGAGHKGQVLEVAGGLFRDINSTTRITAQLILTHTDADYNRSYFGVSAVEAADTGLPEFSPGAAWKDTQVRVVLNHDVNVNWTVGFTTTYGRLSDTLAESPIVSLRGDREQWTTGLYVNHRL